MSHNILIIIPVVLCTLGLRYAECLAWVANRWDEAFRLCGFRSRHPKPSGKLKRSVIVWIKSESWFQQHVCVYLCMDSCLQSTCHIVSVTDNEEGMWWSSRLHCKLPWQHPSVPWRSVMSWWPLPFLLGSDAVETRNKVGLYSCTSRGLTLSSLSEPVLSPEPRNIRHICIFVISVIS